MSARVDLVVSTGFFRPAGEEIEVENNVWLVGDDDEVLVVDPAHDPAPVLAAVAGRRVVAVVVTHGHNDHVEAAPAVADATGAPLLLHPADRMLWDEVHPGREPGALEDGARIEVAGTAATVLHTPGHTPGAVCLHLPEAGVLLSGDTLFRGGPGNTSREHGSFPTIIDSLRARVLGLPGGTRVLPGHGPETLVVDEAGDLESWVSRGY